jgi:hypothetical protein
MSLCSVIKLSVIVLNVVILSLIMQGVIMPDMPSVIVMFVMAPSMMSLQLSFWPLDA